jgi:membrane associated rhomboid family serine protease
MFMHGNILHLLGNMVFLWVFGDNVEDAMGHVRFLVFYLLCGVFAGLAHSALLPSSQAPLIGASGAVAGVVVAYLIMNPRVNLWVLFLPFFPVKLTAGVALGLWVALQFIMPFVNSVSPTAWWAHIGGIVAGAVLVFVFRRANSTMTMSGGPGNQHR